MNTLIRRLNSNRAVLTFISLLLMVSCTSYAQSTGNGFDCSGYKEAILSPSAPEDILYLFCPLQGAINIGLYFVGAALIILILYGAIKAVTSVGDPKQLEGAKMTWNYALFGFVTIILSVSLIGIAFRLFASTTSLLNVTDSLREDLLILYNNTNISSFWDALLK
jgi:hypothetical protein